MALILHGTPYIIDVYIVIKSVEACAAAAGPFIHCIVNVAIILNSCAHGHHEDGGGGGACLVSSKWLASLLDAHFLSIAYLTLHR